MLVLISDPQHPLTYLVKDDPVRPEIPLEFRVSTNRFMAAMVADRPEAMVCVSLHDFVPECVEDLSHGQGQPDTAVFYTIWSYRPGAASALLAQILPRIRLDHPHINRFITLSPKTAMARQFHLKNGAKIYRENQHTINYEYCV